MFSHVAHKKFFYVLPGHVRAVPCECLITPSVRETIQQERETGFGIRIPLTHPRVE